MKRIRTFLSDSLYFDSEILDDKLEELKNQMLKREGTFATNTTNTKEEITVPIVNILAIVELLSEE